MRLFAAHMHSQIQVPIFLSAFLESNEKMVNAGASFRKLREEITAFDQKISLTEFVEFFMTRLLIQIQNFTLQGCKLLD